MGSPYKKFDEKMYLEISKEIDKYLKKNKNKKKTLKELQQNLKDEGIGANRKVAKNIFENKYKKGDIVYIAKTPFGYDYNGFRKGTARAYIYEGDKDVSLLFSDVSYNRAKNIIKYYDLYRKGKIDSSVWNNYINNGYLTRKGLLRTNEEVKNNKLKKERMDKIARSHADYLGNETGNSEIDHMNRVNLRN